MRTRAEECCSTDISHFWIRLHQTFKEQLCWFSSLIFESRFFLHFLHAIASPAPTLPVGNSFSLCGIYGTSRRWDGDFTSISHRNFTIFTRPPDSFSLSPCWFSVYPTKGRSSLMTQMSDRILKWNTSKKTLPIQYEDCVLRRIEQVSSIMTTATGTDRPIRRAPHCGKNTHVFM